MISANVFKQLIAAQQLQLCSAAGAAVAVAALGQGKALAHQQQRSLQTSAEQLEFASVSPQDPQPSTSASSHVQQHWDDQQQQAWAPSRALPPPSAYGLKITIKAHDLLFVKMASTAIRDLIMVNVAPKSQDVLPEFWRDRGAGVPWVNLVRP